jgi:hypothetical protein
MNRTLQVVSGGLLLVVFSFDAQAVMPPSVYRAAAQKAAYHVQVRIAALKAPSKTPGACLLAGKVVRIFRNRGKALKAGQVIHFAIHCKKKGDPIPPGGVIWKSLEQLKKAQYVEVALNGGKGGKHFEVALHNSSIIKKPSKKPQYGFPFAKGAK